MNHSIIVVDSEKEIRDVIRQLQTAGCEPHCIHVLSDEAVDTEEMLRPRYTSRIGFSAEQMAYTMATVFRGSGMAMRSKLISLGLAGSAIPYYEEEISRGRIVVVAVPSQFVYAYDASYADQAFEASAAGQ
ncbi:hypothetical protein PC41400_12125 [Paenibacillus chitinolyticus]|uniref:General stress protein n=1 Tax=Paenibacillus chitinolyticus TaxID=79263 RepID=A0A410WVV7_9BACL|nr:general stress protein [Paenibacillus chitinolyticus]MCY9589300.1 general stress protein [Paenibacillus chitinolyticus]MCY9594373.1 general stress protein [Paenibacillus chitinolyticus]QAV18377.1 hypothetical protein PC41400_12125 [Paenibacillus chitinolyticus]